MYEVSMHAIFKKVIDLTSKETEMHTYRQQKGFSRWEQWWKDIRIFSLCTKLETDMNVEIHSIHLSTAFVYCKKAS